MARQSLWQDDFWLMLIQLYLKKPMGVKPVYSRAAVNLALELHIHPAELNRRMHRLRTLDTPRLQAIWEEYASSPRKLAAAIKRLRSMKGYGLGDSFYEGVETNESWEQDFRETGTARGLTPVALTIILDEYFRLTPITMNAETEEVRDLARLLGMQLGDVVDILTTFQHCDPYLQRQEAGEMPYLRECRAIWNRYGNDDPQQLAALAATLKEYYSANR